MWIKEYFFKGMKLILNYGLSIWNIFELLKINWIVNYLFLNKFRNDFPIWNGTFLWIHLLKVNCKRIFWNRIWMGIWNLIHVGIYNRKGNWFKNKCWFIFKDGNKIHEFGA